MNSIVFEVLWNKTLFFYGSVNYSAQYFILFYWLVQLVKGNFKSSVAVPDICKDRKCQWSLDFTIQQEYKQMLNCVDIFLKWPNLGSCSRDCAHYLICWWYDDMRCTRGGVWGKYSDLLQTIIVFVRWLQNTKLACFVERASPGQSLTPLIRFTTRCFQMKSSCIDWQEKKEQPIAVRLALIQKKWLKT